MQPDPYAHPTLILILILILISICSPTGSKLKLGLDWRSLLMLGLDSELDVGPVPVLCLGRVLTVSVRAT